MKTLQGSVLGNELQIVTRLHKSISRDYVGRMVNEKVACSKIARRYGQEYWDGDRRFGYGGYKYDGRWKAIAGKLIERYSLPQNAKILDVGCGKGFLLYEFRKLLPQSQIKGFDISSYAIANAKEEIKDCVFVHKAQDPFPFKNMEFDLVISVTTLFNLNIYELKASLQEIERVGRNKFISLESYRNEQELFNLQCWALTCELFFRPEEWVWLFSEFSFSGDYEFIFFE